MSLDRPPASVPEFYREYIPEGGLTYAFALDRREFVGFLGAGLLITATARVASAQGGEGGMGGGTSRLSNRLHVGEDGTVTVFTGKVELGQGARTELSLAAAEELRLPLDRVNLVMSDTDLVPDDGLTVGSQTTPNTIPQVRRAAAAARMILIVAAASQWGLDRNSLAVTDGTVRDPDSGRTFSYADLARTEEPARSLQGAIPSDVELTDPEDWWIMGTPVPKIGGRSVVTGENQYTSDIRRPDMLYGKVLRPPSYGATLLSVDLAPAEQMEGVVAVHDGNFVGCAAPTSFLATKAVEAVAPTAVWEEIPQPSSEDIYEYLKQNPKEGTGFGARSTLDEQGSLAQGFAAADKTLEASYFFAYIQHAPMEPRAAVAEWNGDRLTVWTGTQGPFQVQSSLASAFRIPRDRIRVIAPDTGGGFGGKNSPEAAVEAARLARAAERPVSLRFTREEEFTWAYFRPGGVIDIRAGLDADGKLTAWDVTNFNSGDQSLVPPYNIPNMSCRYQSCDTPLTQSAYRALAATANCFARESFLDELAEAAGKDPLDFRLEHAANDRLRGVLEAAASQFGWKDRRANRRPGVGIAVVGAFEKMSYMAACIEVEADRERGTVTLREVCEAFECGAVLNPRNVVAQIEGGIMMGLGGALEEAIRFENGKILNPRFSDYPVPRYEDVPKIDVVLVDRPDIPSVGAGETPILGVAPGIANAIYDAIGVRVRSLPLRPALAAAVRA